jgi:hypothetical protein
MERGEKKPSNAPLSIGEGSGVRFCDIKYILPILFTIKGTKEIKV